MNITQKVKCAVPSKGRLSEPAIGLLHRAGYEFRTKGRNLYATCTTADIVFIFVRADDIPVLVASGAVDLGITGSDLVKERGVSVAEIMGLGFGKCRLCVAVKEDFTGSDLSALEGANVATSFPKLTAEFFASRNVRVNCLEMKGSVEIMVDLNLAAAIADIVETGDSLRDNGLKIFAEIGSYETVLIANEGVRESPEVQRIQRRIQGILIADRYSLLEYNIPADKLREAEKIAPGFNSPTVSRLDKDGWCSVKVMVEKAEVIGVMDKLAAIGAAAIIETSAANCRL